MNYFINACHIKTYVSFFVLFVYIATTTQIAAQSVQPLPPEIITCFTIKDEKGRPLNLDGIEPTEIVIARVASSWRNEYPATDLRIQKLENISEYDYLTTQPIEILPPFTKRYIYNSSRDFRDLEILVRRVNDADGANDDTMRIIFTGQNKLGNPKEPVAFVIDDIRFQKGSYVVDCKKNLVKKKRINFNNIMQLDAYYLKNRLEVKKTVSVPPTILKDYRIDGFTFYKDSLFDYRASTDTYPPGTINGHGVYRMSKKMISLRYKKIPGNDTSMVIKRGHNTVECCTINCRIFDKDNQSLHGVAIVARGKKNIGTITRENGVGQLKCANENFPLTLIISVVGYREKTIRLDTAGNYEIKYTFNDNDLDIDPGTIEKGIFTDFTEDYIGIYWIKDDTKPFSIPNQEQMDNRMFYFKRNGTYRPIRSFSF